MFDTKERFQQQLDEMAWAECDEDFYRLPQWQQDELGRRAMEAVAEDWAGLVDGVVEAGRGAE